LTFDINPNVLLLKIITESKMTSSLANFISSLVAGGLVVVGISVALIIISKSDRVTRS